MNSPEGPLYLRVYSTFSYPPDICQAEGLSSLQSSVLCTGTGRAINYNLAPADLLEEIFYIRIDTTLQSPTGWIDIPIDMPNNHELAETYG